MADPGAANTVISMEKRRSSGEECHAGIGAMPMSRSGAIVAMNALRFNELDHPPGSAAPIGNVLGWAAWAAVSVMLVGSRRREKPHGIDQ